MSTIDPFIKDVQEPSTELLSILNRLESHLEPLLSHPSLSEYASYLSDMERCDIHLTRSRLITQLYWIFCKINRLPIDDHEIIPELQRLSIYENKLDSLRGLRRAPSSNPSATETFLASIADDNQSSSSSTSTLSSSNLSTNLTSSSSSTSSSSKSSSSNHHSSDQKSHHHKKSRKNH